jgi:hypothetical protein
MVGVGLLLAFLIGWVGASARSGDDSVKVTSSGAPTSDSSDNSTTAPPATTDGASPSDTPESSDSSSGNDENPGGDSTTGSDVSKVPLPSGVVPAAPIPKFTCPAATVTVSSADDLTSALKNAKPGTVIQLKDGTYKGNFTAQGAGTASAPIYLCGGKGAVLESDGPKGGYVLHFNNASYWRASGFTVTNGQKGVMVDAGHYIGLQNLIVQNIGDEGVHLRKNSTFNVVRGLTIRSTGHRRDKFGEGVYVGSAQSNWKEITGGQPDHSDHNFVLDNTIYQTTAESVDIKEGTTGGVVAGNTFDGSALTGADSWVDVKGNGWLIAGNHGTKTVKDGFQTHVVVDGWGDKNRFIGNVADLGGGTGVGYYIHKPLSNQVNCNNKVSGGALSNDPCRG